MHIRSRVGSDYPVIVRFSANENVVGGRTEAESYEVARHLEERGADAIHVSNGVYGSNDMRRMVIAPMFAEHAFNADTGLIILLRALRKNCALKSMWSEVKLRQVTQ